MQKFTPGAGAIGFAVYLDELDRLSAPTPPVQRNSAGRVMLNVALPKGRLGDRMYDLLARIGYGCTEDYNATRKLVVENPAAGIRYFLVKPSDVALYVEHGAADVGICLLYTSTFQTLSYTIDVYRREVKTEHNIIDFGAYVVMFPQLIAGPIVKYRDVSAQLHVYKHRYSLQQIEEGMTLFTFGLAKKVLLADAVGALWTDIIGIADSPSTTFVGLANASTPLVWLGVIAYSLQLYFDFSGYSMMAIGMGKMLGFDFPQNFNFPYISRSITEFWRRWHMTLSGWFREYVYIPVSYTHLDVYKRQIPALLGLHQGGDARRKDRHTQPGGIQMPGVVGLGRVEPGV